MKVFLYVCTILVPILTSCDSEDGTQGKHENNIQKPHLTRETEPNSSDASETKMTEVHIPEQQREGSLGEDDKHEENTPNNLSVDESSQNVIDDSQEMKNNIEDKLAACRMRLEANPQSVFEWDNSIELDNPQNRELVEAIVEEHALEWVKLAASPDVNVDLSQIKEDWPFSHNYRAFVKEDEDTRSSLPQIYLHFYESCFQRVLIGKRNTNNERTLADIKNDKMDISNFLSIFVCDNFETCANCFDENENAYKVYSLREMYGPRKTFQEVIKENGCNTHSPEVEKMCFDKIQEEFSPLFDGLMKDISLTRYPAWYLADDAEKYINMNFEIVDGLKNAMALWDDIRDDGLKLRDIKTTLSSNGLKSDRQKLRELLAKAEATNARYNHDDYELNLLLNATEELIWRTQVVYVKNRFVVDFGKRVKEITHAFRNEMPQSFLGRGQKISEEKQKRFYNNDFDLLLRMHEDYIQGWEEKDALLTEEAVPPQDALGVGVIPKSRVFGDVCFGMSVQEVFQCEAANKIFAHKYDINQFKDRRSPFTLEANTTLFGEPASVIYYFHPALCLSENGKYSVAPKLCALQYSVITSDEDAEKLNEARQKLKEAADRMNDEAKLARTAREIGWDNAADRASMKAMKSMSDVMTAGNQEREINRKKEEVLDTWMEGFQSAKKPYVKFARTLYTNNPHMMKEFPYKHNEIEEANDPDLNVLQKGKSAILIYPARYMSLLHRQKIAAALLVKRFALQYAQYKRNIKIQENINDF